MSETKKPHKAFSRQLGQRWQVIASLARREGKGNLAHHDAEMIHYLKHNRDEEVEDVPSEATRERGRGKLAIWQVTASLAQRGANNWDIAGRS